MEPLCVSRFILATIICILVQYILLAFTLMIVNMSPFTPINWILSSISNAFSFYSLLYVFPLTFVIVGNGVLLTHSQLSSKTSGRLKNLIKKVLKFGFQLFTGLLLSWIYLRFLPQPYSSIKDKESGEVNKRCIVVILSGILTGAQYFFKKGLQENIQFPIIQQSKYVRIKLELYQNVWSSLMESFLPSIICSFIITTCIGTWTKFIGLSSLFEVRLFCYTWILFAHIACSLSLVRSIFEITLTDYHQFPIEKPPVVGSDTCLTLAEALKTTNVPLIQHLATYDLYTLAHDYNTMRRKQLYSLSTVGGHPYNWRQINDVSLSVVKEFINNINSILEDKKPVVSSIGNVNNNEFTSQIPLNDEKLVQSKLNESLGIRSLLTSPVVNPVRIKNMTSPIATSILSQENFKSSVSNTFCARFLFGGDKSKKVHQMLVNHFQKVTWTTQAIACLAAYSLKEDRYGVVQGDLPQIIKTLLDLHRTLENLSSLNVVVKKIDRNYLALRQATRRSVYKIIHEFKDYLNDLVLDNVTLEALKAFTM